MSTSFFGIKLHSSLKCSDIFSTDHLQTRVFHQSKSKSFTVSARQWHPVRKASTFCGKNVNLLRIHLVSRKGSRLKCTGEKPPFTSRVRFLTPLWKKGLLLLRASVYIVVISGLCLLVWFGKNKAKGYVEANVLPSVCSVISEYIQRDVQFGKVRRISPLSITLESCSFGPHKEEFSCGEAPTVKIRLHPLASLRRGKLVVDAVLSHPSILVAQKKDYSWLGVPSTNGGIQRHLPTEEGIDYRTRTRRISREEAAARMARERDDAAREAGEKGYFVSEQHCDPSRGDDLEEIGSHLIDVTDSNSFFCANEGKHDHHSMNTGVDYDMNHADLENSFGLKFPCSGLNFWPGVIKGCWKHKFKRKAKRSDISASGVAIRRRILECSALAAQTYFHDQSHRKFGGPSTSSGCSHSINHDTHLVNSEVEKISESVACGDGNRSDDNNRTQSTDAGTRSPSVNEIIRDHSDYLKTVSDQNLHQSKCDSNEDVAEHAHVNSCGEKNEKLGLHVTHSPVDVNVTGGQRSLVSEDLVSMKPRPSLATNFQVLFDPLIVKLGLTSFFRNAEKLTSGFLSDLMEILKSDIGVKVEDIVVEHVDRDVLQSEGLTNTFPITLDSVHFRGATVMLLAYGDMEVREMENVNGHVKFHNHYSRIYVQLSGNCKTWRSSVICEDGGWLSANVFVDTIEQKWHANLKIDNLFVPLFERILEIPITWSKGRASGKVHLCMSKGETFPNLYGQLDMTGLNFQLSDAPSCFSNISASLCFRGQRIYLHNASGWFGSIPLEGSGDFGIHPEEGEYHLMFQVPGVEVNALMRTFNMRPLLFPIAGSVTALFNCQGPLDSPIFVGTGMVSRTFSSSHVDTPASVASEALAKCKEIGALAAIDCIPFSSVSANFTFNTDNCVADLYGIRANLVDGGELQGAGTAWICPEGEEDETAIDLNFAGSLALEKVMLRYVPNYHNLLPLNLGVLHGETKLSGSLRRPRFDIKWTAPTAEGSFSDARGDIIISHDFIIVNSASSAFDLYMKVRTSCSPDFSLKREEIHAPRAIPFTVDGAEFDLHMCGFEFFSLDTYALDFPRPLLLKATGRIKFQGKVLEPDCTIVEQNFDENRQLVQEMEKGSADSLVGEVSISGLKLNQLMLAPQLSGLLRVSPQCIKLDASGRPDESLAVEFIRPLQPRGQDGLRSGQLFSILLQKGQLRANVGFQQGHSVSLEIQHFPLDELELASLRGTIQRAEIEFNLQKIKGHGIISVLRPKFSGAVGEALDMAARWSGDVITIEKIIFQQSQSHYELQGEYVLPGTRDCNPVDGKGNGFLNRLVSGNLGSVISSMGRWRMKLEVHKAEIAEMLPLARLLSRSTDPAIVSRSKDFFVQSLQSVGIYSTSPQELLELIRRHLAPSHDVVLQDLSLLSLSELKGCWHGSLDATGGGNGDTLAEFDFQGEDWELGDYKAQRVLAVGAYGNDYGLHLENFFIQKDNSTVHADGTLLGPKTNLHFAVLNLPVSLVPTIVEIIESTATDVVHSLRQLLAPIKGILHMEGDLRGSLTKPECDVQIRLLDGTIGGVDIERAEVVASLTSTSRFLFNAKFEPVIQNGHVLIQGSIPVTFLENNMLQQEEELDNSRATWSPDWVKEKNRETADDVRGKKNVSRDRNEKVWNSQLVESLKGLNWQSLDTGEVRVDADIKDGGMMLVAALSPYAKWLHGNADVKLEVRGTVDQPLLNGYAAFHRVSISSPVFRKPLTNFGGTVNMKSNRLSINSLESRLGGKGKLLVKGNLPLRTSEEALDDKIELKCEILEVQAKSISGQVDSQVRITGSILEPIISGNIKLSHGEVYLPHDGGGASNIFTSIKSVLPAGGVRQAFASRYISRYFSSGPASLTTRIPQSHVEKDREQVQIKPHREIHLSDLKLMLGPELNIVYPLILKFAVNGELELNGLAHPKYIRPRGILVFENGKVELVATQVRLKQEHPNTAKFEPEYGLDPMLDLALVGSGWQYRIQRRASNWQDPVEQDALSHIESARRFESQLAETILEGNGRLAFEKLATATLEKLMPRIEGEGEFGQAKWKLVYSPQIPSSVSADPTVDPFRLLASNLSFGTDVEVQLGKRLQARIVRQMKESEMATQWTLSYQLANRLHLRLQSASSTCIFFEYYAPF